MLLTLKRYLYPICYTSTLQLVFLQVFRHMSVAIQTCETVLIHRYCVIRFPLSKPLRLETRRELF